MAEGNAVTKFVLDLDNSDFMQKMRDSTGILGKMADPELLDGLKSGLLEIGAIAGTLAVAYEGAKHALDWSIEAESIKQTEAAFGAMTKSVGVNASSMKAQLEQAAGGMLGEKELLTEANKGLAMLGTNAAKVPEIMALARKASALYGGTLADNFERLNMALVTGRKETLNAMGITFDAQAAEEKYAKSIGTSVDMLSQAGKQQAVFNAALDSAKKAFAGVDVNITATQNTLEQIKATFSDIKDIALLAWNAVAGPWVHKALGGVLDLMNVAKDHMEAWFGKGQEKEEAEKRILQSKAQSLKESIALMEKQQGTTHVYSREIEYQKNQLEEINKQLGVMTDHEKATTAEKEKQTKTTGGGGVEHPQLIDLQKVKAAKLKFSQDMIKLTEATNKAEEASDTNATNLKLINAREIANVTKQAHAEEAQIRQNYLDKGLISHQQYAQAVEEIEKRKYAQILKLRKSDYDFQIQALKNLQQQNQFTAQGFSAAWSLQGAQAQKDFADMSKFGTNAFGAIEKNSVNAFKAIGDGSKNAADALRSAMFGAIGDIATQEGQYLLMAGIGTYDPIKIAEGGALIALGSALSSMGSSKSSGASSSGGGGGSVSSSSSSSPSSTKATAATPQKALNINISGHYFETDQTRQHLMDIIRQSGDYTDFNLRDIGQA